MKAQRYRVHVVTGPIPCLDWEKHARGEWVRYEDAEREREGLLKALKAARKKRVR